MFVNFFLIILFTLTVVLFFQFQWKNHLMKIFPESYKINDKEVILATSPIYLHNIADLIKKTDKRFKNLNYIFK